MFEDCDYNPTSGHPIYLKFKELQKALKESEDDLFTTTSPLELETPAKVCDSIYICEELPDTNSNEPAFGSATHLLLIAPTQSVDLPASPLLLSSSRDQINKAHIETLELPITDIRLESLLVHLRSACDFIQKAIKNHGTVLIHCLLETRSAQVVCAYLMEKDTINAQNAFASYEKERPLFAPQQSFFSQLEVFENCGYNPTSAHPKVIDWINRNSPSNSRRASSAGSNTGRSWSSSMGNIRANWSA